MDYDSQSNVKGLCCKGIDQSKTDSPLVCFAELEGEKQYVQMLLKQFNWLQAER